jgi:tight adherence protein B
MTPVMEDFGLIAAAAAGAAGLIALMLMLQLSQARSARRMRGRLDAVRARISGDERGKDTVANVRKEQAGSYPALEALARRVVPRPALLRYRLAQTGLKIGIGQYALICVGVGLGFTLMRSLVFHLPLPLAILLGVVSGLGIPHFAVGILIGRRIKRFLADFPEAIDLIIRGLRSGLPVPESIRIVGQEFKGPVGEEFSLISDRVKFGQPLEEALWDAAKRIDQPDFKFFVVSLAVQRETGGNLAETLENLSDILRKRRQMKLRIRAMSSEARASAMILGALPFLMFAILYAINGGYVLTLFTDPRGHAMLGFAFACLAVGIGVMWKMVRFEI